MTSMTHTNDTVSKKRLKLAEGAEPGSAAADLTIDVQTKRTQAILDTSQFEDIARYFRREELASMPLEFRISKQTTVSVWRADDGSWFRGCGLVRIQRLSDGRVGFKITLFKGGTREDIRFLERLVEHAREGKTDGWKKLDPNEFAWCDDRTFSVALRHRPTVDPQLRDRDASDLVIECDDDRCRDAWHLANGSYHQLDWISRELKRGEGSYDIRIERPTDEPAAPWNVNVYANEFYGHPDDVAEFVNDLQWLTAECAKANANATANTSATMEIAA